MQSTVRRLAPTEMSENIEFLTECLNADGVSESFESQAETAGRVAEVSAFTLMQQSRRMLMRPLSLSGIEVANSNKFFVNLGNQAETCARPLVINDAMFHGQPQIQSTRPKTTTQHKLEGERQMPTATTEAYKTPFAWDFRAQNNAVDARSVDRAWDWPALDEDSFRRPEPLQARVWSKEPSRSRIPAQAKKQAVADAACLRELLDDAMNREAQKISQKVKVFTPEATESHELETKPTLIASAVKFLSNIKSRWNSDKKVCA